MTNVRRAFLRKTRTLWRQPLFVWVWLLPVWVMLGISKAMIGLMSFQGMSGLLGQSCGVSPWVPLLTESALNNPQVVDLACDFV